MYAVIYYGMVINIRKKKQKIVKEYAKYMFGDSLLEVEWWRKPNLNTLRGDTRENAFEAQKQRRLMAKPTHENILFVFK